MRSKAVALVTHLAQLQFNDVFNPYSDLCDRYDKPNAPRIRKENLIATIAEASHGVDALWIALEPGHRGARRTGLAMTDDRHLEAHASRWGLTNIDRATASGPYSEQTAGIVWDALSADQRRIFLWNVFPLHSHKPNCPFSNRRHTAAELEGCWDITTAIIGLVRPAKIVAIGGRAYSALIRRHIVCSNARHPSYGGKSDFLAQISDS